MFAYFSKNDILTKKNFLFTTTQNTICLFLKLSFSMLFIFSPFLSPTQKRPKQKMHFLLFEIPFLTPRQPAIKTISHPYTLFAILNVFSLSKTGHFVTIDWFQQILFWGFAETPIFVVFWGCTFFGPSCQKGCFGQRNLRHRKI